MKKIFFSLFFPLWEVVGLFAQATVTPISVNYDLQEVTFRVAWNAATAPANRVWVWVDFCSVAGTTPGSFTPATISPVFVTNGSYDGENGRGLYIYGNPSTVTAALSNAVGQFNWCAYGSDYPPNILDYVDGTYTLRGTPPFTLKDANGNTQIVTGTTIAQSSLSITPITMTDETGCPGYFCKYVGMDLHMNVSYPCQQRTSGAQNWEAHIKDNRDNQIYRITQFSDDSWWMAEDMNYDDKIVERWDGHAVYRGQDKPDCPSGWRFPTTDEWTSRYNGWTDDWGAAIEKIRKCNDQNSRYCRWDGLVYECPNSLVYDDNRKWNWNFRCNINQPGGDCDSQGCDEGRARCRRQL
jgi:hypothetical protein